MVFSPIKSRLGLQEGIADSANDASSTVCVAATLPPPSTAILAQDLLYAPSISKDAASYLHSTTESSLDDLSRFCGCNGRRIIRDNRSILSLTPRGHAMHVVVLISVSFPSLVLA